MGKVTLEVGLGGIHEPSQVRPQLSTSGAKKLRPASGACEDMGVDQKVLCDFHPMENGYLLQLTLQLLEGTWKIIFLFKGPRVRCHVGERAGTRCLNGILTNPMVVFL